MMWVLVYTYCHAIALKLFGYIPGTYNSIHMFAPSSSPPSLALTIQ